MKFKSMFLLCIAWTLCVARAQVYSSDGVGYVNVTLTPGYNMIANPLVAHDNSIGALFQNFQGGVPNGLTVYKLVNGNFVVASYFEMTGTFEPADAAAEITLPGDGVWVFLPGDSNRVLTFVGEVEQGDVCTDLPRGFSIKSNPIPRAATLEQMRFPASAGDFVYVWNPSVRNFTVYNLDPLGYPPMSPIPVGHSFFVYHAGAEITWCQTFFIIVPQ
jgi:hypothetical protein